MIALSIAGVIGSALFAICEMVSFFADQRAPLQTRERPQKPR